MPILHEADEASMVTDGQLQLGLAALAVNQKAACVKQDGQFLLDRCCVS
jgi:hypothetical protein